VKGANAQKTLGGDGSQTFDSEAHGARKSKKGVKTDVEFPLRKIEGDLCSGHRYRIAFPKQALNAC